VELYNFGFKIILNIGHDQKSMNKVQTIVLYQKRLERSQCKCTHLLKVLQLNCSIRDSTIKMIPSKIM